MTDTAKLRREVWFLKMYASAGTLAWVALFCMAFASQERNPKFEEIDVERINIVEADGSLRMVISNRQRQHPGIVDGKLMPREHGRPPGMIFFNHLGDECGGLIFDENGGKGHFVSLTMDKSRQDQTIGMQHLESDNGDYFAGLTIWDRPHTSLADSNAEYEAIRKMPDEADRKAAFSAMRERGEFGFDRVTIAKLRNKTAMISLSDPKGRPRIRLSVDPAGDPKLEFLDEQGLVFLTLPESFD